MPNSTSSAGLIKHLLYELKRGMQPLGIIEKKIENLVSIKLLFRYTHVWLCMSNFTDDKVKNILIIFISIEYNSFFKFRRIIC